MNFNLRNVPEAVMILLKKEAAKQNVSVNSLILKSIENSFHIAKPQKKIIHHDLDHLAGTWTEKDKKDFDDKTKSFERIDQELWE